MNNFFEVLTRFLNNSEKGIIDFLSVFVPYAVPVIPAYLTFNHTQEIMDFPIWVAVTAAFVVEALGLSSVATAVRFWRHNKKYTSEQNRAPFKIVVFVYVFYITVVILVNVILEIVADMRSGWVILAIALFSLLSFPASLLVSVRYIHGDILEERENSKKTKPPIEQNNTEVRGQRKARPASFYNEKILEMLNAEYTNTGKILAPKEITARLKLDHDKAKGYVSTLTTKWKAENNIKPPLGF
jgi:hypothetical protein